jgi:zinc protease
MTFTDRTYRTILPNGLTLLVLENPANPTVSVTGYLRAGDYFDTEEKTGVADLTAAMLNKGTEKRSKLEIAEALEFAGASVGFSSHTFSVGVNALSLKRDFEFVLGTLTEELRGPAFPEEELEKLRQRTLASIQRAQENTRGRAVERLSQILFPRTSPFHQISADESVAHIQSITTDDLKGFYKDRYGAAAMILAIVGDVKVSEVEKLVTNTLGDWQGAPPAPIDVPVTPLQTERKRDTVHLRDKANVDVIIGHASQLRRANDDYLAAIIANRALGQSTISSRLGLKVRDEMGLTYGINSSFMDSGLADGPYVIGVTLSPENIDVGINATMEIVEDFVTNGIREDELQAEQSSLTGTFKIGLATNAGMADQLASSEYYNLGVAHLDNFPEQIKAITKTDVDRAIRKYIHPEIATTVIAGTLNN